MTSTVVLILIMIICFYLSISTPVPPLIPNIQLSSLNGCGLGSSNNVNEEFTSFISTTSENPRNIMKSKKHSLLSNKTIEGLKRKIGSILTKVQIINKNSKEDAPFNGDDSSDKRRRMRRLKFWSRAIRIYGS